MAKVKRGTDNVCFFKILNFMSRTTGQYLKKIIVVFISLALNDYVFKFGIWEEKCHDTFTLF